MLNITSCYIMHQIDIFSFFATITTHILAACIQTSFPSLLSPPLGFSLKSSVVIGRAISSAGRIAILPILGALSKSLPSLRESRRAPQEAAAPSPAK